MGTKALRGQVYRVDFGEAEGEKIGNKYFVVVSNNERNRQLNDVLGCRITSTKKPILATIVPLTSVDPCDGSVLCDDIVTLYGDELTPDRLLGAMSPATMIRITVGLSAALGIPR